MRLTRPPGLEYRVSFNELHGRREEETAYYTDDLEDAVFTGQSMRRKQVKAA